MPRRDNEARVPHEAPLRDEAGLSRCSERTPRRASSHVLTFDFVLPKSCQDGDLEATSSWVVGPSSPRSREKCSPASHGRTTVAPPNTLKPERENPAYSRAFESTATGIRTPVSAVRGRRPSPLDDGGLGSVKIARQPLTPSAPCRNMCSCTAVLLQRTSAPSRRAACRTPRSPSAQVSRGRRSATCGAGRRAPGARGACTA